MSDTTRLGVSITASDTATATIAQLAATAKALEQTLKSLGGSAADAGGKITASLTAEIAVINREIAARGGQAASIRQVTVALQEQATAAAVVHRTLQQGIDASLGIGSDRAIKSAAESARVLTTSLSAAAEADGRLRTAALETAAALETQAVASRSASRGAMAGGEGMAAGALLQRESRHIVGLFDSLARGQRGQAVSSIGAAARDAGLGIAALSTSMVGLVALMGGAALIHGAESMGKLAADARANAAAAGMSIEAYSRLQGALVLTGAKADEADTSLRKVATSLSSALANASSEQAEAFHNLGISQEELAATGGDVSKVIPLLADAFGKYGSNAQAASNFNEIAGRSFEHLFRLMLDGKVSMEELEEEATKLGITWTTKTAQAAETTGTAVEKLSALISGGARQSMIDWGPTIETTTGLLGEAYKEVMLLVGALGQLANFSISGLVKAVTENPLETYQEHVRRVEAELQRRKLEAESAITGGGLPYGPSQPPPPALTKPISETSQRNLDMAKAEAAASASTSNPQKQRVAELQAGIAILKQYVAADQAGTAQMIADQTTLLQKQKELNNVTASQATAAGNKAAKQSYADFANSEKLKIAEAQGSSAQIIAIYDDWIAQANSKYKQHVSVIEGLERQKVDAVNRARLDALKASDKAMGEQSHISDLDAQLRAISERANTGGRKPSSGDEAKIVTDDLARAQQIQQAAAVRVAADQQIIASSTQGSDIQKAAAQDIVDVVTQAKEKEVALYTKAADAAAAATQKLMAGFNKLFDSVGSAFETFSSSVVKALIAPQQLLIKQGLTSITENMRGSELKSAMSTLLTSVATDFGKSVEEAIGSTIAKALSGGAADTIGQLLSQTFSKVLSSITGGALGSAVGNAAGGAVGNTAVVTAITAAATTETTGFTAAIATNTATTVSAITAGAASVVAAVTSSAAIEDTLLSTLNIKPSAAGFTYALGGIVPSAAGGMVVGGTGGSLAILHAREMVLPAPISTGIQNMIQNGGNSNSGGNNASLNYSPTINTASRSRGGTGMTRGEFSQMMSTHSGALLGEARNMMRSGWRPA